ncbi:hypothetical protein F5984_22390 [Rudanella paleaurantiibacter]|uniref:Universal stress protein n=1 Tax=Rudanella paleaurantiibacter TaxID=2614655 RepID=A0A7J5TU05_9BACT|nr:hypothetical protein [Rudanella paleaurantiibacter]KAB7727375.1 hypothetical protein F5984_22390 [Rudanella paleaurantiibacter]
MSERRKILIPTDFRVSSLHTLRLALGSIDAPKVDVVLLYGTTLDTSITEMLFYSPRRIIADLLTDDFREGISILVNRFESKIGDWQIELFHGYRQRSFDALLATLGVDTCYMGRSYPFHLTGDAFDLTPFLQKTVVPCHEVDWAHEVELPFAVDALESLFLPSMLNEQSASEPSAQPEETLVDYESMGACSSRF